MFSANCGEGLKLLTAEAMRRASEKLGTHDCPEEKTFDTMFRDIGVEKRPCFKECVYVDASERGNGFGFHR